MAVYDSRSEG